jgi:hypothetical protein
MTEASEQWQQREESLDMPPTIEGLLARLGQLFELSKVESITVQTSSITVKRWMPDEESPVIPPWTAPDSFGAEGLMARVLEHTEEIPADKWEEHPHLLVLDASQRLERRGLVPVAIVAPKGPQMASWLGSEQEIGSYYMGCRVIRGEGERYAEKIALLGARAVAGRAPRLDDIEAGVLIDIGGTDAS